MAQLKKYFSGLLEFIKNSCEKATFLISKKEHEKLNNKERLSLQIHLLTCRACRRFEKQMNYLTKNIDDLKNERAMFELSEEEKAQIQRNLMKEAKK